MTQKAPAQRERRAPTQDQLHEKACIDCGSSTGPFVRAGHIYLLGLGWAVVSCVAHTPEES